MPLSKTLGDCIFHFSNYYSNITNDGFAAILSSPWYINFVKYGYKEWYEVS